MSMVLQTDGNNHVRPLAVLEWMPTTPHKPQAVKVIGENTFEFIEPLPSLASFVEKYNYFDQIIEHINETEKDGWKSARICLGDYDDKVIDEWSKKLPIDKSSPRLWRNMRIAQAIFESKY